MIPFGPYRPDQPEAGSVLGVYPVRDDVTGISYAPFPMFNTAIGAAALGSTPYGAFSLLAADGTWYSYVGTSTTIEQVQADWSYSSTDTGLSLTSGDDWSFEHFGAYLIYTNTTEGMRAADEDGGSPAAVSAAPAARFAFGFGPTLMALDCDGDNRRWQTCAYGDHTTWVGREANGQTLLDGGELVAGGNIGNNRAIVVQSDAVHLFVAAGGGVARTQLARQIGSVGQRSFRTFNGVAYWLDKRGFFRSNGGIPEPIGDGKVDKTFLAYVGSDNYASVEAIVAPSLKLVLWAYDEYAFCYSWVTGEFGRVAYNLQTFFRLSTPAVTLASAASLGTLADLSIYPLDSPFWAGGAPTLAGIDTDGKVGFFDGGWQAAVLETSLVNYPMSQRVRSVTPVTDDTAATAAVGYSDGLGSTINYSSDVAREASGRCPVSARGKNISFRTTHAADGMWSYDRGIDHVEAQGGGRR